MAGAQSRMRMYVCVLIDAAGRPMRTSAEEFAFETDAVGNEAKALFAETGAACCELWHSGRRIQRVMKPGPG